MKRLIFVFTLLLAFSSISFAQSQEEDSYRETLQKMFEVAGSEETYKSVIKQMFSMFKQQYSEVEQEVWVEFEKEFLKSSIDELTEMLMPVYQKYLTIEDLEAIIVFYETPAGKKFARYTPVITQESMQIGQEWGMKIGEGFEQKMREKGY